MEVLTEESFTVDPFVQAYRDSLKNDYDAQVNLLNQQRENAQDQIMSEANRAGMAYSNFPARTKMQYDVGTYQPALVKARNTYQTGLDSLRNQGVNLANQIKSYQEGIADYNYYTSQLNAANANGSNSLLGNNNTSSGLTQSQLNAGATQMAGILRKASSL